MKIAFKAIVLCVLGLVFVLLAKNFYYYFNHGGLNGDFISIIMISLLYIAGLVASAAAAYTVFKAPFDSI